MVYKRIQRLVPFLPSLEWRHVWGPKAPQQVLWDGQLFGRSREVVGAMVGALGLSAGDVVLAPASLCWDALAPMLAQGVVVRCYPLDSQLHIDTDALKAMLCPRTKALYIVHYFGYPQRDVSALGAWCSQEGLKLIEDCALCLYDGRHRVGQWGDVSFFSLWKYLPIPDGAIALIQNGVELPPLDNPPDARWLIKRMLRLLASSIASNGLVPTAGKLRPSVSDVAAYEPPGLAALTKPTSMSAISRSILARCDIESIAEARRANYSSLVEGIGDIGGVEPIWREFPEDSVPFALPIRVSDPVFLQGTLAARGIETEISVNRFFRNHPQIEGDPGDFKAVDEMADRVLSLPVHQGMSHSDIERLIQALHNVA
jgi:dTDP-4-amino-4,6-dideoxygalactose transaminase